MIMLRSTHQIEVKRLEEKYLLLFDTYVQRCHQFVCQIEDLKRLVFPPVHKALDPVVLEADSVISGSDKPQGMSEDEHNAMIEGMREADRIMSGTYDEEVIG